MKNELEEFLVERREALMSLDEKKIRAYFLKWNGTEMPMASGENFWNAIHKAITGAKDIPIEFRRKSKAWLSERGYGSLDEGEL